MLGLLTQAAAAAGLAALALVAADTRAAPPIPVSDFVRRGLFSDPSLSPDGNHLVVKQRIQKDGRDVTLVVVYRLADMKIISTVRLPVFEEPAGYSWVTNTRLAVTVAREFGSLERPQLTGEVLAMDIDGQRQQYLYGYKPGQLGTRVKLSDSGWATSGGQFKPGAVQVTYYFACHCAACSNVRVIAPQSSTGCNPPDKSNVDDPAR